MIFIVFNGVNTRIRLNKRILYLCLNLQNKDLFYYIYVVLILNMKCLERISTGNNGGRRKSTFSLKQESRPTLGRLSVYNVKLVFFFDRNKLFTRYFFTKLSMQTRTFHTPASRIPVKNSSIIFLNYTFTKSKPLYLPSLNRYYSSVGRATD